MGAPKPCLGYPSRTAAVVALRGQQLTTRQIADRIGVDEHAVLALEHSAGRSKRWCEGSGRTILFAIDTLDRLRPHAEKRGCQPTELARRIVKTVVDEGIVDAVLDDGKAAG